ncbi:unnamed protein product [Calicophoron daubneyi]|uniref:Uncharacterized protein n=1 Tax=Calicophoron daubneyi TaxID=300641 RepID=A0AAV2TJ20_CALDB
MNPFEKRDKIPRTPPGESFLMRSSFVTEATIDGNCSIYDECGVRSSYIPSDLKCYTLTFEDDKYSNPPSQPFDSIRSCKDKSGIAAQLGVLKNSNSVLTRKFQPYTSSPIGIKSSKQSSDLCMMSASVVLQPIELVSRENKENLDPLPVCYEPATVLPNEKPYTKDVSNIIPLDVSVSVVQHDSSANNFSTVRRLRSKPPKHPSTPIADASISTRTRSKRSHPIEEAETSSDTSEISTVKRGRLQRSHTSARSKKVASSSSSPDLPSTPHKSPSSAVTPATVVANPRTVRRRRRAAETGLTSTEVAELSTVGETATVRRPRRGKRRVREGSATEALSSTVMSTVDSSSIQSATMSSQDEPPSSICPKDCSVGLNILDISAITATVRRPRRRGKPVVSNIIVEDEPVAARLRRRTTQISYVENSMTTTGRTRRH